MKLNEVNQTLKQFLVAGHRIDGDILPTPEDQKKALQLDAKDKPKTLDQTDVKAEPLKDRKFINKKLPSF